MSENWGKGAENNDIGWGQGSNNDIEWGSVYAVSHSGDTSLGGSGFDPDASAFFAAVEAEGGTLSPTVKTAWNDFVIREKDNSRYTKIKRLYPYLGGVINSCRIDAITLGLATNNNFVDADCDPVCGLQGDGSTKCLLSDNYDVIFNSPYKLQLGYFALGGYNSSTAYRMGASRGATYFIALRGKVTGFLRSYIGSSVSNSVANNDPVSSNYSRSAARFSQTSLYGLVDQIESAEYTTSVTYSLPSEPPAIFCVLSSGTPASFTDEKYGLTFFSEFDTLTETKAFEASYKTFLTDIGAI